MAVSPRQRQVLLGLALAATLGLTVWLSQEEEPAAPPAAPSATTPRARGSAPAAGEGGAQRSQGGRIDLPGAGSLSLRQDKPPAGEAEAPAEIHDIFAKQSWYVPPPPPPPGPPQPPPLPYTYMGKMLVDGQTTVYLSAEDRNVAVRQGDVIDGTWKVKSITPTVMTLVYLPMNKQQTLQIGRAR